MVRKKKPFVLVTNDDGIAAPGLSALVKVLREENEVAVVAPSEERSAVGHAITLSDPLRVWSFEKDGTFFGHAVNGTPADCVKIAVWALLDRKPDILVSGINLGSNTGINIIYSGTVSAATEGAILGIPSFAISLTTYRNPDFRHAAWFAGQMVPVLLERKLPRGVYLNVNVPACSPENIAGSAVTRQGLAVFEEKFDKRTDPHGRIYYWLSGQKVDPETDPGVDEGAIQSRLVSVTPVHTDLTRSDFLSELRSWPLPTLPSPESRTDAPYGGL